MNRICLVFSRFFQSIALLLLLTSTAFGFQTVDDLINEFKEKDLFVDFYDNQTSPITIGKLLSLKKVYFVTRSESKQNQLIFTINTKGHQIRVPIIFNSSTKTTSIKAQIDRTSQFSSVDQCVTDIFSSYNLQIDKFKPLTQKKAYQKFLYEALDAVMVDDVETEIQPETKLKQITQAEYKSRLKGTFTLRRGPNYSEIKESYLKIMKRLRLPQNSIEFDSSTEKLRFRLAWHELEAIFPELSDNIRNRVNSDYYRTDYTSLGASPKLSNIEAEPGLKELFQKRIPFVLKEAQTFYSTLNPEKRSPIHVSLPEAAQSSKIIPPRQILDSLLSSYNDVVIGERHSSVSSKKVLIENMDLIKQKKAVIVLEHFLRLSHQALLDEYISSPRDKMPARLEAYANYLDKGYGIRKSKYNFKGILKAAKAAGVRIIALETDSSYTAGFHQEYGSNAAARYAAMNYISYLVTKVERRGQKVVHFIGSGHVHTRAGIPGVSEIMGNAPTLVIDDESKDHPPAMRFSVDGGENKVRADVHMILPVANERVASEPVNGEPSVNTPVVGEPAINHHVASEPVTHESLDTEPIVLEPIISKPVANDPFPTVP